MKPALIPQCFFLAGIVCFLIGTVIGIKQTIDAPDSANINCGADRP